MYNIKMQFNTPIHLATFHVELVNALRAAGVETIPYIAKEVTNTIEITNASKIPNKDTIATLSASINQTLKDTFAASKDIAVTVAGETAFAGYTSIEEI